MQLPLALVPRRLLLPLLLLLVHLSAIWSLANFDALRTLLGIGVFLWLLRSPVDLWVSSLPFLVAAAAVSGTCRGTLLLELKTGSVQSAVLPLRCSLCSALAVVQDTAARMASVHQPRPSLGALFTQCLGRPLHLPSLVPLAWLLSALLLPAVPLAFSCPGCAWLGPGWSPQMRWPVY